eukprot:TRINITY_DN1744_c0_g1_i2.p1 TRINITY_DN1744_c0_g1~~TRINITY_DN1744_c0_g1_i2.p1  ORF type:complete len:124 (+),score=20.57 TRINITY_DN1744_c0_g1_i2:70-441(+)
MEYLKLPQNWRSDLRLLSKWKVKMIESGDLDPDQVDNDEDEVPMITMDMMRRALKESKRSVSPAEYQKYLSMKVQFDREAGVIADSQQQSQSSQAQSVPQHVPAPTQQPNLLADDDDDDSDIL